MTAIKEKSSIECLLEPRGWVYVMTNKAMPGIVKIGFSTEDPKRRALRLSGTGVPHAYHVKYELVVKYPQRIEQKAHARLFHRKEGKEWFRCTIEEAIREIQIAAHDAILSQSDSNDELSSPAEGGQI